MFDVVPLLDIRDPSSACLKPLDAQFLCHRQCLLLQDLPLQHLASLACLVHECLNSSLNLRVLALAHELAADVQTIPDCCSDAIFLLQQS